MESHSTQQLKFIQLAACLGFVVVLLDVSVVNVALQALSRQFIARITDLQWVVNAYSLVFAALLLTAGALGDRLGAKRVFMLGFAIFTLGSVCCGLSPSLPILIVARILQGFGAALLVPASLSLIRQVFVDAEARSRAVGWWAAGGGIALAAGPVIGGFLISAIGWRSIFLVNLPIGLIGLWIAGRFAPTSPVQSGKSLDIAGQITGAVTLASLTIALTEASSFGWDDPIIYASSGCFILFGILFVWLEGRNPKAMLPLSLFSNKTLSSSTLIGLLANLTFYGMVFTFSLYFQFIREYPPLKTGLAFLPMMGIMVFANIAAGRYVTRVGARNMAATGLALSALGYLLILPGLSSGSYELMSIPMLIAGGGIALTIPTITNATLAAVAGTQAGIASGLLNASRQVGGVIGVALFGFLVRFRESGLFLQGMKLALELSSLLLLLACVLAFRHLAPREISVREKLIPDALSKKR
ncbi:MFS transporter [Serratia sp. M24T3]|uniref:MFS transporter n=1 Tax=Serratia sp. M24T3 TaxID=932213 RepID=UPI00025BAA7F|nr:MFS transporter [Serratia sp. M24T3]EIC86194.1 major facilitator transporter [Serratia sp. M24T3]